jgi:hypothetical protein
MKLHHLILIVLTMIGLAACEKKSAAAAAPDPHLASQGTIEVTARLVEIPEGAIFQRDLYDYAAILKYEVVTVHRGSLEKGSIIYIGHYNPTKPRSEAADKRVKDLGGNLRQFRTGDLHHMALETPMDEHYLGGIVDKYFGKHEGPTHWALWTDLEK